uniref:non-specific serine/threonine protein kinase n=1 Tax=Denticeps clupeoides TaxID=299321 RepID=A0AAY4BWB5_9TELE
GGERILECIGEGGSGQVHKARNLKTGHLVAMKIQEWTHKNFKKFMIESLLLQSLVHQNIPKLMGMYSWKGKLYICMELYAGGDLDDFYTRMGSLKESQLAFVAKEVLETLLYLHQKGYMHRDIKPPNILLTDAGEVRLVDFGLMLKIKKKCKDRAGTIPYVAPEIALEYFSDGFNEKCDVWSVGMTLLELAEGGSYLLGTSKNSILEDLAEMMEVPRLTKRDKWSPVFRSFLEDALTLDPAMRPSVEVTMPFPA